MAKLAPILCALLVALAAPLATPGAARAQDGPVLVELYTSQGCSSCPPADALLHKLAARGDVVALALHVDYWDYIGWKDVFANPEYSARQRAYARVGNRRMVYTPQMIIHGVEDVVGNRPKDVAALIERHRSAPAPVALSVGRQGGELRIEAKADTGATGRAAVQLVRYRPSATVDIRRGENAGRTLTYSNIVTDWKVLQEWDMRSPLSLTVPMQGDQPAVVLIQRNRHGPVQAVARVE